MTDQDKITALRDALQACQDSLCTSDVYDICERALTMTAEASEPSGEPVAYLTADKKMLIFADSLRFAGSAIRGYTPLYTNPATKQASPATDSEAALQALADQSQELEFTPTRRAFDQSALDQYAERAK